MLLYNWLQLLRFAMGLISMRSSRTAGRCRRKYFSARNCRRTGHLPLAIVYRKADHRQYFDKTSIRRSRRYGLSRRENNDSPEGAPFTTATVNTMHNIAFKLPAIALLSVVEGSVNHYNNPDFECNKLNQSRQLCKLTLILNPLS